LLARPCGIRQVLPVRASRWASDSPRSRECGDPLSCCPCPRERTHSSFCGAINTI
jgi:hypothetical protein